MEKVLLSLSCFCFFFAVLLIVGLFYEEYLKIYRYRKILKMYESQYRIHILDDALTHGVITDIEYKLLLFICTIKKRG